MYLAVMNIQEEIVAISGVGVVIKYFNILYISEQCSPHPVILMYQGNVDKQHSLPHLDKFH